LRDLLDLAIEFAGRGLVELCFLFQSKDAYSFQKPQGSYGIGICGILGRIERDLHMALGGEVVYLVRLRFLDDPYQVRGVGQVAVMHEEIHVPLVRVPVQVVYAIGVE